MLPMLLVAACYEPAPDSYTKDTDTGEPDSGGGHTGADSDSGEDTDTGGDSDTGGETGEDSDTGGETAEDTDTGGETGEIDTMPPTVEHCGDITADETWAADAGVHVVTCMVHVNGATLTIEAGAEVQFGSSAGISVADDGATGALLVAGTAEAPVRLYGEDDTKVGAWQGLRVEGFGTLELHNVELTNGGSSKGAIYADGGTILADVLTVDGSATYGLQLKNGAAFDTASTSLDVSRCEDFPVLVGVEAAATLPDGTWTDNAYDGIEVGGGTITEATTWRALEVPWVIAGDVEIQGTRNAPATWTIDAGTTLAFEAGASLSFSPDGGASGLVTNGTADAPVLLTAWDAAEPGIWGGVTIDSGTEQVELHQTTIEYGAADAALDVTGADVLADGLTLRGAPEAGFRLGEDAAFAEGSGALSVDEVGWPGELEATAVSSLATMDLDLLGADDDLLYVSVADTVTSSMEWPSLGLPYWLEDNLSIDGTADDPAIWTIDPGVTIYVGSGKYIRIAHAGGAAGILAVGTEAEPIVFTAGSSATAGAWGGIGLYGDAVDASCSFDHVEIGYGGGSALSGDLHLDDASPTIDHAYVHHSADYGIYRAGDAAPVIGEVTYEANEDGDLF